MKREANAEHRTSNVERRMAEEANVQPAFARDGLRRGQCSTACPERSEAESNGPNAEPKPKANIERRTPNAEHRTVICVKSLAVFFCGPDACHENSDQFFCFPEARCQ